MANIPLFFKTRKGFLLFLVLSSFTPFSIHATVNEKTGKKKKAIPVEETVSIGYGETLRSLSTSSITSVNTDNLEKMPGETVLSSLQGRVAGLLINENEEGGVNIQFRGQNSLVVDNTPLFIVDGAVFPVRFLSGSGAKLNPLSGVQSTDIEKIEILKDADATAIYGAKAANGVVMITTKKGSAGKTRVSAEGSVGFSRVTKRIDLLNVDEYLNIRQKALNLDGITPTEANAYDLLLWGNKYKTDWQKELLGNTARVYQGQLSVAGGNDYTSFSCGLGYYQTGLAIFDDNDDKYKRINARMSINHQSANKRFNLVMSTLYSSVKTVTTGLSPQSYIVTAPNQPLYDDKGSVYWIPDNSDFYNPLRFKSVYTENILNNILGNLSLRYEILTGLQAKIDLGYTKTFSNEFGSYGNGYLNPYANNSYKNQAYYGDSNSEVLSVEPQFNYSCIFGKGRLTALLGFTWQSAETEKSEFSVQDFPSEALFRDPASASVKNTIESSFGQYKYASVFSRLTYDFRNKYVINGIIRRDGSSRFAAGNQYGTFWSIGGAWLFSREKFFNIPFVSFAKLRGSYGATGNDQVGDFLFLETYTSTSYAYDETTGLYQDLLADPAFSWEVTKKAELALDLGFFKDKLIAAISLFDNRSNNLIVPYPLPSQTGFASLRTNLNEAKIQNRGLEIELSSTNISTKDFKWTSSFNISFLDNNLLEYPNLENSPYATSYEIGRSINLVRAYKYLGVDRETGVPLVQDTNGDGSITTDDKIFTDETDTRFYGGLFNTFKYKGFVLDVAITFVNQPYRLGWLNNYPYPVGYINKNVPRELAMNSWTPENPDAKYPGLATSYAATSERGYAYVYHYRQSDAAYSDASYIRLQNVGLTYMIPSKISGKVGIQNLRVYAKVQNLLTITGYDSWDPQTGNAVPPTQTFIFGAKLSF
ncbi:MAG: SusC/RagA family TonB-linked outer membrane protein [Tannerellaceae bacterium]|jgi:TonB-linked SusC/RagA family outer membrane protein|nr:SusC/RagA family TonB-linked outer membrane protein [Tannerellaceae bacterium]